MVLRCRHRYAGASQSLALHRYYWREKHLRALPQRPVGNLSQSAVRFRYAFGRFDLYAGKRKAVSPRVIMR